MSEIRTGNYVRMTIKATPWYTVPVGTASKAKEPCKRNTVKKKKFPIFSELAVEADDEYWKEILEDCSNGKFPKGFFFRNENFCFKRGKKVVSIPSSQLDINTFVNFVHQHGGFISNEDKKRRETSIKAPSRRITTLPWKKLSKGTKERLIENYVRLLSKKYEFDESLIYEIKDKIQLYIFIGEIKEFDIDYRDNMINEIKNVKFDSETSNIYLTETTEPIKCEVTKRKTNPTSTNDKNNEGGSIFDPWIKKFRDLSKVKKVKKNNTNQITVSNTKETSVETDSIMITIESSDES